MRARVLRENGLLQRQVQSQYLRSGEISLVSNKKSNIPATVVDVFKQVSEHQFNAFKSVVSTNHLIYLKYD